MKTTSLSTLTKNILPGIFAILITFSCISCATKASFVTSSVAPAARGDVSIRNDKNKNYIIEINIVNLAEVERLQSMKQSYVAWLVTDQQETKNIGRLKSSGGFISKQLKASLTTISATKPVKIFITAEEDPNVQYPGSQVILSTDRVK